MNSGAVSHYYLDAQRVEADAAPGEENQLLTVALALNQGHTAERLIDLMFETLEPLVPCGLIGIAKLDGAGLLTLQHVRSRLPARWKAGHTVLIPGSGLAPIIQDRKIRIIDDLELYVREHPGALTAALMLAAGIRSSLSLPVTSGKKVIGVVFFSAESPRAYSPLHVEVLRGLAAGIGTALERAELSHSLRLARRELESLDGLKTRFLGNLSHELRTPLTTVLGSAYLLQDGAFGALPVEQAAAVDDVVASAERLNALLDDMFDFTLLETGRLRFERAPCELAGLVREVVASQRPAIERRGLKLAVEPTTVSAEVDGNVPLLARAVRALLDNACKFTPPPGEIQVAVGQDGPRNWVEVRDTGIGIGKEAQAHIFEKFFQVDGSTTRAVGGAGLGLALVRAIVHAHKGTVWFESKPQQGSRFRLSFPACAA